MNESLVKLLVESCIRNADRVAIGGAGDSISYSELLKEVEKAASALGSLATSNDRYGVLLPNLPVFPVVWFGALRAGRSVVMLNPLNSARENAEHLSDAEVDTVITVRALEPRLPSATRAVLVDDYPDQLLVMDGGKVRALDRIPQLPDLDQLPAGDAEAAILYTAANDGWARGAVLSHRNLCANLQSTIEAMRLTDDDDIAVALPLIHAFGLTVSLNASLIAGSTLWMIERFHPIRMLEMFTAQQISVFAGVPAMFMALITAAARRGTPQHSLRVTLSGGAPLPAEIARQWEQSFGIPLRQGYGLTEAGPVCAFNNLSVPNRPGTLGPSFPGVEAMVMDSAGKALPTGEIGELCVRGENVFAGYLNEPDATRAVFHGDWLRTGDLASIDADGYITFRGVLKPMFTRNGFNVYPRELERVLEQDARIREAHVSAQPDLEREHEIVINVRPADSAELSVDDVREICRDRLAAYKQPSRIHVDLDGLVTAP